jgi:hypothetical protein
VTAVNVAAPTCTRPGAHHLAPTFEHAEEIAWYGATVDTARSERWTCSGCHPNVHYELMVLGGLWFIRRTGRSLYETIRGDYETAVDLWHRLLAGSAR